MRKRVALLSLAAGCCMGVTCTITGPGGGGIWPPTQTPLDQTDAEIVIEQTSGGAEADVTAAITDRYGRTVELGDDQSVKIEDVALSGPDSAGQYTATVDAASQYTITVREPTRGVENTTIAAPPDFQITSPAADGTASLSGFTLSWSGADDSLEVEITLTQTFAGARQVETFGPLVDTGSRRFDDADLRDFVQGADLLITVTKIDTLSGVAGFDSATVTVCVSASRTTSPGP